MANMHQFVRVEFTRFKAFRTFRLDLKHFNIMVGPNNAGKSTILAAFRILAAAQRRASAHRAVPIRGPHGTVYGYEVNLASISVAEENIFYNYEDDEPARVVFQLSNGSMVKLHNPELRPSDRQLGLSHNRSGSRGFQPRTTSCRCKRSVT